jgi:hypothetical protein
MNSKSGCGITTLCRIIISKVVAGCACGGTLPAFQSPIPPKDWKAGWRHVLPSLILTNFQLHVRAIGRLEGGTSAHGFGHCVDAGAAEPG